MHASHHMHAVLLMKRPAFLLMKRPAFLYLSKNVSFKVFLKEVREVLLCSSVNDIHL